MTPDTPAATAVTPTEREPRVYSADRPLLDADEDRLGRRSFANRIADSLVARRDPSSLVVGLYGEWGDGKSTVLNFVERRLQNTAADSVICVRFNPWLYGDEPTVINEFFRLLGKSIDAKLDTTSEKVGKYLRQAGSRLSGVSVGTSTVTAAGTVFQSVGGFLPEATLTELRDRVEKALQAAAKRVVVFIDDVDRLDRQEITTVMRLVKIAADFSFTAYVLAFDPAVVAAALAERYPNGSPFGENFLEKIVQVPLTLPRTDAAVVRQILLEDVERHFETHEIQLTPDEATRLWMALDEAVLPRLRTVRIARRLSNALEFALPIVPGEVNAVDVVLIEALRTLYPQAYDFVKASVNWIVSPVLGRLSREEAGQLDPAMEGLSARDVEGCKKLLRYLFPQLDSVFGNGTNSTDQAMAWTEQRRICSPRYCERYFAYGIPVGDIADAEIVQLMRSATAGQADTLLESLFQRAGAGLVLQKLSDRLSEVEPDEVAPLARVLCEYAPRLDGIDNAGLGAPALRAALIVIKLTRKLPAHERTTTVRALVGAVDERFALLLFRMLRSYSGPDAEAPGFDEADVTQLGREFAERLLTLDSTVSLAHRWPKLAVEMYACCAHYGSRDAVIDRVIKHAAASIDEAAVFIRMYLPDIEHFAGRYSMSGPTPLRYQEFAKVITAGRLVDAVRANLPDLDERVSAFLANPSAGPRVNDLDAARNDVASVGVRFAALHTLMTASESLALEPSVTTLGPESLSSGRGSPSSSYVFDERRDAALTIRVLTDLPAHVGDFRTSARPASTLPQTERDSLVIDLLEGAEVTALLNVHFETRGHESTVGWELRGDNIDDRSRAHSVPAAEGVPIWCIAYIETGWLPIDDEPVAGEPTQGVRLVLDLKLDLHGPDQVADDPITAAVGTPLQLHELANAIVAALGSANLAMDAFDEMLQGAGDIGSATVTCWIQANNISLDRVVDASDFRAIPGNAARSDEVFGWTLAMPHKRKTPVLTHWPEETRREAVRELLRTVLQRMGRRGFETAVDQLWR